MTQRAVTRTRVLRRHLARNLNRHQQSPEKYDWSQAAAGLPRLPIPRLDQTVSEFCDQLRPLLEPAELAAAGANAQDFLFGPGPRLQAELEARDAAAPATSYVKPFWDAMYLRGRYPVPINSNPFVAWEPDPNQRTQLGRATSLVFAMLKWRQGMLAGQIEPDLGRNGPLCMSEYARYRTVPPVLE